MAKINPIELQKSLKGVDYPASKEDLVRHVQEHDGNEDVRQAIENVPDEEFQTPADVSQAVAKGNH